MSSTDLSVSAHKIDPDSLSALPRTSGVYIFKGEGTLPLYIGKSVDIRSRVMSHLRTPDEASMIAQTRRIDFIETAGEIGALLLEARLIKQKSPLYNIRLRRLRNLCAIHLAEVSGEKIPEVITGKDVAIGESDGLYGLFGSVHAAHSKLRELADKNRLCLGLLGLEKMSKRGCFGLQIKTCLGACVGKESRDEHDQRFLSALADLKVEVWPFAGAVDLTEQKGDWVQRHRIQGWRHIGSWCSRAKLFSPLDQHGFDLDTYKILVKPIMLKTVKVEAVDL
jgi:excinuclease Cho